VGAQKRCGFDERFLKHDGTSLPDGWRLNPAIDVRIRRGMRLES
jgi:hypothetical protein